jgi:hypothetical protein
MYNSRSFAASVTKVALAAFCCAMILSSDHYGSTANARVLSYQSRRVCSASFLRSARRYRACRFAQMNELERLWSNVLSERSALIRSQKSLVDAQKKYSHAVDLFHAHTETAVADAILTERGFNTKALRDVNNGETGI